MSWKRKGVKQEANFHSLEKLLETRKAKEGDLIGVF